MELIPSLYNKSFKQGKNMKYIVVLPTVLGALISNSVAAVQNEISFGISDLNDYGNEFIGLEYKRYLSNLSTDEQPYSLLPYLSKTNSVHVRYFGVDSVAHYELGGQWFQGDEWVINSQLRYTDYDRGYSNREKYISGAAEAGYFFTPEWQVGAGLIYEYEDRRYFGENISDNQATLKFFSRYTNIIKSKGWDYAVQAVINDSTRIEMDVRYFFNQDFSVGMAYLTEFTNEDYGYINSDVVEFNFDYWFTPGWSLQIGAGVYSGGDESGLAAITLSTSTRF